MKTKKNKFSYLYSALIAALVLGFMPNVYAAGSFKQVTGAEADEVCSNAAAYRTQVIGKCNFQTSGRKIKQKGNCGITWVVDEINGEDVSTEGRTISYGQTLDFTNISYHTVTDPSTGLPSVTVLLKAKNVEYEDEENGYKCKVTNISKSFTFSAVQGTGRRDIACPVITQSEIETEKAKSLNCDEPQSTPFNKAFCDTKNAAVAAGHTYDMNDSTIADVSASAAGTKFKESTLVGPLKCEYDVNSDKVKDPDSLVGEEYFLNKDYFYAEHKETKKKTYVRYYTPGNKTNIKTVTCTKICSEAVIVEYGPPVAKKAGMCFEYRVRVTSRVDCHADTDNFPEPPECECGYCTPIPLCIHTNQDGSTTAYRQGGPNDEYDACVADCDGGQYTKKCSSKCYKKVYGSQTSNQASTELMADKMVSSSGYGSLADCISLNPDGCYTSGPHWSAGNKKAGRWYRENSWGIGGHNYVAAEDGFMRAQTANGLCQDSCSWENNCGSNQYLNPNVGKKDCEENNKKWRELIEECNRQAVCNTTTSYYTIDAGYNETTIYFPDGEKTITNSRDRITGKSTATSAANRVTSTLLPYYPEPKDEHNGIKGCYNFDRENDPEPNRLYRTTWGFPNTWMNAKTGEISYSSQDGQTGWGKYTKKFCIPFDQKGVNQDFWNAFYNKNKEEYHIMSLTTRNSEIRECIEEDGTKNTIVEPKAYPYTVKWNINGHTRKFGFFGWNIDISCFYATNPKPTTNTDIQPDGGTKDIKCTAEKDNIRVRSVDLEDLFPATDGSSHSPDAAGRTTGFNWSEFAVQHKNEGYQSDPVKAMQYIQNTGYKIYDDATYSDKYLDYKFVLTPTDIRRLRGDNSANAGNYTDFNENNFYMDENGVIRYFSEKIRDAHITDKIVPDKSVLKCNNIGDYRTGCNTAVE